MSVRSSKARSSQVFTAEFDCFSKALTVDLDSSEELHEVSSGNACKSKEEFLLSSIVIFALRNGYLEAAEKVIQLYPQFSANPPRLAVWCCAAMLFPKIQYRNPIYNKPCSSSSYTGLSDILQVLISAADSFRQVLDDSSRYKQYINEYVNESKRVIMHIYLESVKDRKNYSLCLARLNRYFPMKDTTPEVEKFRQGYLKLLASEHKLNRYLDERWIPARCRIFRRLQKIATSVAAQLPEVMIDKVGSREWKYIDGILLKFNSLLALIIRQQLLSKSSCSVEDILEIVHAYNSQSCPSQLLGLTD